mmetsp:Transcript_18149/g.23497  ORF Transcript_18149/g.23497 Transcript_18149/m.23497 type:complete len:414 (+) Transcript_18149:250-1491(+)
MMKLSFYLIAVFFVFFNDVSFGFIAPKSNFHIARQSTSRAMEMVASLTRPEENQELSNLVKEEKAVQNKIGVVLLNLGGPDKLDDVEGFLYNLFADPDIIRLPSFLSGLQTVLASIISKRRAPKSSAAYESIGGGSPIMKYTKAQAKQIEEKLTEMGIDAKCYIAMRYWHPYTEEALKEVEKDGVDQLVILPLYPQFSISTSGSSLRALQEKFVQDEQKWDRKKISHTVIPSWYDRPGYVRTMGKLIRQEIEKFTPEQLQEGPVHVLFSAHGVPKSYIEVGDPYQEQIIKCVDLISKEYSADVQTHLSYQSRVGPIEWLRPYTDDKLIELAQMGVKNLAVVPISFVSEHIETLEEIDMEYRELAEENGIKNWRRVPALNTDKDFTDDMALLVKVSKQAICMFLSVGCWHLFTS